MRVQASPEGTGGVLRALVAMEDKAEAIGRAPPSDRPLERIRDRLLGHASGHRPAHDLPMERVDRGCEAEPSFARSDVADPPLLRRPQGAERLQRPGHHAPRHSGHVAPAHEQALEAHRRAGHKPQARMVARRVRPRLPDGRPRQGEGQAGLLPVLLGEEEAREADKARLALGPSARKERGRRVGASCP